MSDGFRNDTTKILLLFIAAALAAMLGTWALAQLYPRLPIHLATDIGILIPGYRTQVVPEPMERFIFLVLALAIPLFCFAGALALFQRNALARGRWDLGHCWLVASLVAVLFLLPLKDFEFSYWLLDSKRVEKWHAVVLLILFALAFAWYWTSIFRQNLRLDESPAVELGVFLIAAIIQIAAWRVVSLSSVFSSGAWNVHFDAVVYTLSQVVGGKTLLADLPSQYGMSPEFMGPIFKVIGLSTLSFTIVCAVLQLASLGCIWWVLYKCVRDRALRVAGMLALVMVTFETVLFLIGIQERYFQYWPIRFLWPAISVLAFYRYSRMRTWRSSAAVSAVAAFGALWNADSGVMIVLAFAAFLAFKLLGAYIGGARAQVQRSELWKAFGTHFAIVGLISLVFLLCLALKADGPLHLSWLYEYQIAFYKLGFTMLPMPTAPSAWMTVMGVYVMGLAVGFVGIARSRRSWRLDNLLFVSMLGVGVFIYYQGRSHILNLITVSWPSILVGAMLADRIVRAVRARREEPGLLVLPAAALAVFAFCALPFLYNVPKFIHDSVVLYKTRNQPVSDVVPDEIAFIRTHSKPRDVCAILAVRQGIDYAETGLVSPLVGPGYIEMVLLADRQSMLQQLRVRRPKCVFLGIGQSAIDLGIPIADVLKNYAIVATSKHNTMQYWVPIEQVP